MVANILDRNHKNINHEDLVDGEMITEALAAPESI